VRQENISRFRQQDLVLYFVLLTNIQSITNENDDAVHPFRLGAPSGSEAGKPASECGL
jgi:hypothetical protein